MSRFMIQVSHPAEQCERVLRSILWAGAHFLTHAEWGCDSGVHIGWLTVEVEDLAAARRIVPPVLRHSALVVEVDRFSHDVLQQIHAPERGDVSRGPASGRDIALAWAG